MSSNQESSARANNTNQSKDNIEEFSMNRVIDFLKDQQRVVYTRDTEFLFEK